MKKTKYMTLRMALYALGALVTLYLIYESGAELVGSLQADDVPAFRIVRDVIHLLVWLALEWALAERCIDLYKERKAA